MWTCSTIRLGACPSARPPLVWRFQKDLTGSGALGDLGSHALDLVRFVTGQGYTRLVSHTGTFVHGAVENWTALAWARWMWTTSPLHGGDGRRHPGHLSASPALAMAGATTKPWRFTAARAPSGMSWTTLPRDPMKFPVCIGPANAEAHVFTKLPIPDKYRWIRCSLLPTSSTATGRHGRHYFGAARSTSTRVDAVLQSGGRRPLDARCSDADRPVIF